MFNYLLNVFAVVLNMTRIRCYRVSLRLIRHFGISSHQNMDQILSVRTTMACYSLKASGPPKPLPNVISMKAGLSVIDVIWTAKKYFPVRPLMYRNTLLLILGSLLYFKFPLWLRSHFGVLVLRLVHVYLILMSCVIRSNSILLLLIKSPLIPTVSHVMFLSPFRLELSIDSSFPSIRNLAILVTNCCSSTLRTLNTSLTIS